MKLKLIALIAALAALAAHAASVTVGWTAPAQPVTSYNVRWVAQGSTSTNLAGVFAPNTQLQLTDLTPGVTYTITVSAVGANGLESGQSVALTYTPPVQIPPDPPTGLHVVSVP